MTEKTCKKCNENKPMEMFSIGTGCKDGRQGTCKSCVVIRNTLYWRTPEGRISKMYATQRTSSKARGHINPTYSKHVLFDWAMANGYAQLHSEWVASGYEKDLCPSVDRLDTTKGYSLSNIRLVTWKENNDAQYESRKIGGVGTKQVKGVNQYNLDGSLVATHHSVAAAARASGVQRTNINAQCSGYKSGPVGGFNWAYS